MKEITVLEAKRYGAFHCNPEMKLKDAASQMVEEDISGLVVIGDDGSLLGIITRTDLLRAWIENPSWDVQPVCAFMSREVVTVSPQDSIRDVARLLIKEQIHRAVIAQAVEDKLLPLGVISDADLVYHMARNE